MINLIIGKPLSVIDKSHHIDNFQDGVEYLESHEIKSVILNMNEYDFTDEEIARFFRGVDHKKTPTLVITDSQKFKDVDTQNYVAIVHPKSSEELIFNRYVEVLDYKTLFNQMTSLSKQTRTIPFYILGTFLILEPLIKTLYLKFDTGFDFKTVFEIVFSIDSFVKGFEYWLLFPIAGIALFRASAYSLFVFVGVYLYSTIAYFSYEKFDWPYVQESPHFSANLFLIFNTALLVYFLIPENRKPFTNRTIYFFRKSIRVSTFLKTDLRINKNIVETTVLNISDTGVMLTVHEVLTARKYIELNVNGEFIRCQFIREINSENEMLNYGLRFSFESKAQKRHLKKYLAELEMNQNMAGVTA